MISNTIFYRNQEEESLRKKDKAFLDITSSLAEGIYVMNQEGTVLFMNPEAERLLGWTMAELSDRNIHDIVHYMKADGSLLPFKECGMRKVMEIGVRLISSDEVIVRKDGTVFPISLICSPLIENGRVVAAVTAFRDITEQKNMEKDRETLIFKLGIANKKLEQEIAERKVMEESLRESAHFFQTLMDGIPTPIFYKDIQGVYQGCNSAFEEYLGMHKSKIVGKSVYDISPRKLADTYNEMDMELFRTGGVQVYESAVRNAAGALRDVIFNKATITNADGSLGGLVGVILDITDRKLTEQALLISEERLRQSVSVSNLGIFDHDHLAETIYWSPCQREIYGWSSDKTATLQAFIDCIYPEDRPRIAEEVRRAHDPAGNGLFDVEHRIIHSDGSIRWVTTLSQTFFSGEGRARSPVRTIGASSCVTERRRLEEHLRKTIMERETLLRELYHRTKNNMNTISSLINLQTASLHGDETTIHMFRDLQDRIMSMALVHERLYKSKDLSNVNFKDYVSDLATTLTTGYKINMDKLSLKLDIEDFTLSIDTLIPCGLIINELMTNSLKYAFVDRREGQISIKGQVSAESDIQLVYSDNGIGFPVGFDFAKVETLGLRLINGLISGQLHGKMEITTWPETVFTFSFRESGYKQGI